MSIDNTIQGNWSTPEMHTYTLALSPKPVGYWVLYPHASPHTQFSMYHKPTDEQIKNTEQLLGWQWRDV